MKPGKTFASLCIVAVMGFAACKKAHPKIVITSDAIDKKETSIKVPLSAPVKSTEKSQYWVCVAKSGDPESSWGVKWVMAANDAAMVEIPMPPDMAPGAYEVRLHSDYPAKSYNLVDRKAITVK